jgi:hypothetical protein
MWIIIPVLMLCIVGMSFTYFVIRREIIIDASPQKIWSVLINFEDYKNWNSQLIFLGGNVKPNGNLHLKLSPEGASPYEFKPKIVIWEENKRFAWLAQTGLPRVFDGKHSFELQDLGNGQTLLINQEQYSGILSMLIKQLPMMKNAPQGFDKMNLEIKTRAEK